MEDPNNFITAERLAKFKSFHKTEKKLTDEDWQYLFKGYYAGLAATRNYSNAKESFLELMNKVSETQALFDIMREKSEYQFNATFGGQPVNEMTAEKIKKYAGMLLEECIEKEKIRYHLKYMTDFHEIKFNPEEIASYMREIFLEDEQTNEKENEND